MSLSGNGVAHSMVAITPDSENDTRLNDSNGFWECTTFSWIQQAEAVFRYKYPEIKASVRVIIRLRFIMLTLTTFYLIVRVMVNKIRFLLSPLFLPAATESQLRNRYIKRWHTRDSNPHFIASPPMNVGEPKRDVSQY